ncbi:hypothetical protein V1524DRAFT_200710 [Lipomyces starkeyi]
MTLVRQAKDGHCWKKYCLRTSIEFCSHFGDIEVPRSEYDTNLDADYIFSNDDIPHHVSNRVGRVKGVSSGHR